VATPDAATQVCDHEDCPGARLEGSHCIEHLSPSEFDAAVLRLGAGARLDARKTTITSKRLESMLSALKHDDRAVSLVVDFGEATFVGDANFSGATFCGKTGFLGATFDGVADFSGATFSGYTLFDGARFNARAIFDQSTASSHIGFREARFNAEAVFAKARFEASAGFGAAMFGSFADFAGATFTSYADFALAGFRGSSAFGGTTFSGEARFRDAGFTGYAGFDRAKFGGAVFFDRAAFRGNAVFSNARFADEVSFAGSTFGSEAFFQSTAFANDVDFAKTTFSGGADLKGATFDRAHQVGPFVVDGQLVLDGCSFEERVRIEVAARVVSARTSRFASGGHLRVRWAEIALDDADFARPSTLSGAPTWDRHFDLPQSRPDGGSVGLEPSPRLVTLRGAHVVSLSLSDVDLRACRFFGAHGLESLRIEASCTWPRAPSRGHFIDRETIAEEHEMRGESMGWAGPSTDPPHWMAGRDGNIQLKPAEIAAVYRALRKAREDDKDEAGAGDLYYGEMEMRRAHCTASNREARPRARVDRAILHAYWLVSGYGLRPTRAVLSLLLTLLVGSGLLFSFGFHQAHSPGRSLLFAIESSLSLLRPPDSGLSAGGEVVQIALRLLGPLFFALAVLAVRARVRR
jgi:hypothetical protein